MKHELPPLPEPERHERMYFGRELTAYADQAIEPLLAQIEELTARLASRRDIESLCARIKSADDAAINGDYMLDSNDCISVIRGTWKGHTINDCQPAPIASSQESASEREAFEVWAEMRDTKHGGKITSAVMGLDYPLGRLLWEAWQARAEYPAQHLGNGQEAA